MSLFEQFVLDITPVFGSGEASSIVRIVLEDVFGSKQTTQFKLKDSVEEARFLEIRQRLIQGEPIQYILGQADFFGLKWAVSPAVLIPRQETEELVVMALDWLGKAFPKGANLSPRVLDIGLGSGCIGLSIAYKRPEVHLIGIDKSEAALAVALDNAARILGARRVDLRIVDVFDQQAVADLGIFDLIVSNPPYIPFHEQSLMPAFVLEHEPALALFVSDADPLVFYRRIAELGLLQLRVGGALMFECNEYNALEVADLLVKMGYGSVRCHQDLSGADRIVVGYYQPTNLFVGHE